MELIVVLGVLGILVSLAVPRLMDYVVRGRRADAMISLQRVQSEQEKFYFDNHTYATSLSALNLPQFSKDGYYALSIITADASTFAARAVPLVGGSQAGDGGFELLSNGARTWDPGGDGVYECTWDQASRGAGC